MNNSHRLKKIFAASLLLAVGPSCRQQELVRTDVPIPTQTKHTDAENTLAAESQRIGPPETASSPSLGLELADSTIKHSVDPKSNGSGTEMPDAEWNSLVDQAASGLRNSIRIANKPVSNRQLLELRSAHNLTELLLDAGCIDNNGLPQIVSACPNLQHLRLRLSPIGDEGASTIAQLTGLRILNLPHSELSYKGIQHLTKLPHLELLRLGGRRIDDQAVTELARLPELQSLHLISPDLTDQSLKFLAMISKLSSLYLDNCQFSPEAWQGLKKARPDLHIHLDQPHPDL